MNPLFSKGCINSIYPLILERTSCISQKILERCNSGPINIVDAYRCLTIDIISAFCFSKTLDLTNEAPENFRADYLRIFDTAVGAQTNIYYNTIKRIIWPRLPLLATMLLDKTVRETIGLFKVRILSLPASYSGPCLFHDTARDGMPADEQEPHRRTPLSRAVRQAGQVLGQ